MMRYQKHDDGSYVHNCYIKSREDQICQMFSDNGKSVIASLNGYAVIPYEEYAALAGIPVEEEFYERVKRAHLDMEGISNAQIERLASSEPNEETKP